MEKDMNDTYFIGQRVTYAQGKTAWSPGILFDARITGIEWDEDGDLYYTLITESGNEHWCYPDQVSKPQEALAA